MPRLPVSGEVRATLTLAVPLVLVQLSQMSMSFVDVMMVGRLGTEALAAIVLGSGYLVAAVRFWWNESIGTARGVLYASLIHLPLLLAALTWDHFRLLS